MDQSSINRTLELLKQRRQNVIDGKINYIPSPFQRFQRYFTGIEQGCYYIATAASKVGKTKFSSYLFLYNTILYAYQHQNLIRPKIFYFNLEESSNLIITRFMSYLLYKLSKGKYHLSTKQLRSVPNALSIDVINTLESPLYKDILDFFEKCVIFVDETNPTGINKFMTNYAKNNGKTEYKIVKMKNKITGKLEDRNLFSHYIPDDPDEYVMIYIDHISLITSEQGMSKRESILKLSSEYLKDLRNKYNYIPVVIQQQATETFDAQAVSSKKIRPTQSGLADCKDTFKDANVILGLCSPYLYSIPTFEGYDITKFKDNIRFLECLVDREGESNGLIALYMDGAVNDFREMPKSGDFEKLNEIQEFIKKRDNSLTN